MATSANWNSDWLWENSQRNYPLLDGVSRTSGAFIIPNTFLLDLSVSVPSNLSLPFQDYYIHEISSFGTGYIVTIRNGATEVGKFSILSSTHTWGKAYPVYTERDGNTQFIGSVVIGDLSDINLQPAGTHTFETEASRLQLRCVSTYVSGLSGLKISKNGVESNLITDTVVLRGGPNTRLSLEGNAITVDAIGDKEFLQDCVCEGGREKGEPIRTINGQGPNQNGEFVLMPSILCMDIQPIQNGVMLSDTCSTPCCGCEELEVVNTTLNGLTSQFQTLSAMAANLQSQMSRTQEIITNSPLYMKYDPTTTP